MDKLSEILIWTVRLFHSLAAATQKALRPKTRRTWKETAEQKVSRGRVSLAVSSRLRVNFGEIFVSRGRETNIYRVW